MAYLGHVILAQGVAVDPEKVRAMEMWPIPRNLKVFKSFLGLTGYYHNFIAGYANIAQPLTEQTQKDQFGWSSKANVAFEHLNKIHNEGSNIGYT